MPNWSNDDGDCQWTDEHGRVCCESADAKCPMHRRRPRKGARAHPRAEGKAVTAKKRCEECGSWDRECMSDVPVAGCGCARCAGARVRQLEAAIEAFFAPYPSPGDPGAHADECGETGFDCDCGAERARRDALLSALKERL